jgi:hypothetical protein
MMNRSRNSRMMPVIGLALALCFVCAAVARADTEIMLIGAPTSAVQLKQTWQFPPCAPVKRINKLTISQVALLPSPAPYPWSFITSPALQPGLLTGPTMGPFGTAVTGTPIGAPPACPAPDADPYAKVIADAFTGSAGGGLFFIQLNTTVTGNALAGGLGTAAVGDTSVARDSVRINVGGSGTTVTINGFTGFMRNTLGTQAPLNMTNSLILAVYPNEATANADEDRIGTGANFYGKLVLTKTEKTDRLVASGGFGPTDFVLTSGTLQNSAAPAGGLTKNVNVPSGALNACVVLVADPRVGSAALVPGASSLGLALLSLLMLAGGVWFVSRRSRQSLA